MGRPSGSGEEGPSVLAVIGSINVDLVVTGAPLPGPGETVTGGTFARHQGGKGGNQAVAAARAVMATRAGVAMVGAVGDDEPGSDALDALADEGIDTSRVARVAGAATGIALICVDSGGENQIAVAPGANAALSADEVLAALDALNPGVVLASLEVPAAAVRAGASWCRDHGRTFVLNPAPATPEVTVLASIAPDTVLTPNEGELAALGGPGEIEARIVETRGAEGARIHPARGDGGYEDVPAPPVTAIDTTGAGDCCNGVLAAGLLESRPLGEAVRRAVAAAAVSVTVAGAREGMPTRGQINEVSGSAGG